MNGVLHIVATPIGNLEDVTLRALRVLREADAILAEDTRHTRTLCAKHGITTRLVALHAHTSEHVLARLVEELGSGKRYALVSDAGTPLVSDPGAELVSLCAAAGVRVEPIPGPSAVLAAVSAAGLRVDGFRFVGFLPRSGGRRTRAIAAISRDALATVLFEAGNRIDATLRDLATACGGQRRAALGRELTKTHEEIVRGSLDELTVRFADGARGEVTLVVEGASDTSEDRPSDADLDAAARALLAEGLSVRDVADRLAQDHSVPRRDAYRHVLALAGDRGDDEEP